MTKRCIRKGVDGSSGDLPGNSGQKPYSRRSYRNRYSERTGFHERDDLDAYKPLEWWMANAVSHNFKRVI